MYIFAGALFQTKNPKVPPATTTARAAIKNCPFLNVRQVRKIAEIATVPAAPPSKLSKKLMELHIPTTQITVINTSI